LLRDLMAREQRLDYHGLAIALTNGVIYFLLGTFLFRWSEGKAKRQGSLGGY